MNIVAMTHDHLRDVCEIEQLCFSHAWSLDSFIAELDKSDSMSFVAVDDNGKTVGYIIVNTVVDEMYLFDVAVHPYYRRCGIAKLLFDTVFSIAKDNAASFITLEVRDDNTSAISLYKALGFDTVAVRKSYYSNPTQDAVLMTKYF